MAKSTNKTSKGERKPLELKASNEAELKWIEKKYKKDFLFIPAGPGGKVNYPVIVTIGSYE